MARCPNQGPWPKGHNLQCRRPRGEPWELRLPVLRRLLLVEPRRLLAAIWPLFSLLPVLPLGAEGHPVVRRWAGRLLEVR